VNSAQSCIRAVNDGRFPTPTKANGKIRWLKADLDKYDADNTRTANAR